MLVNASKGQSKRLHLLGPAHVTHPWLFKSFYPEKSHEWLTVLTEHDVRAFLGIQDVCTLFYNYSTLLFNDKLFHAKFM